MGDGQGCGQDNHARSNSQAIEQQKLTGEEADVEQSRLARTHSQLGKLDVAVSNWADATGTALRSAPSRDLGSVHHMRQHTMDALAGQQHPYLDEGLSTATSKAVAASMAVDRELELSHTMYGTVGSPQGSDGDQHSSLNDDLMEI
jgi:hypothetical protein